MTLTVACIRTSHRKNPDGTPVFTREYSDKLRAGVERHLTVPHTFRCLTDRPEDNYDIHLPIVWPDWWCKMFLFAAFRGPTLFLDLDIMLRANIDQLAVIKPGLSMLWMPYKETRGWCWSSAVMTWDGDFSWLAHRFNEKPEFYRKLHKRRPLRADQGFIVASMRDVGQRIGNVFKGWRGELPFVHRSAKKKPHLHRGDADVRELWLA